MLAQMLFSPFVRMRRSHFWTIRLCLAGIMLVGLLALVFLMVATGTTGDEPSSPATPAESALIMVGLILMLPVAWIEIASSVKRLHDINITGWLYLIAILPAGGLVLLILCGFIDGTRGPNKFGPSPKRSVVAEGVAQVFG